MCPDAELLSAWTDGEVPSPWKERISKHLEGCASCAEKVAGFRRLSMRIRSSGTLDEGVVVARIASRLGVDEARIVVAKGGSRGLSMPLPFVAAAAVALLVVGAFGGRVLSQPGYLAAASSSTRTAGLETSAGPMSGNQTMDSLVRYIEAQNAPLSMTIKLPANASFSGGGAPMIVKTPPAEMVSFPPSNAGLGFVMSGEGK